MREYIAALLLSLYLGMWDSWYWLYSSYTTTFSRMELTSTIVVQTIQRAAVNETENTHGQNIGSHEDDGYRYYVHYQYMSRISNREPRGISWLSPTNLNVITVVRGDSRVTRYPRKTSTDKKWRIRFELRGYLPTLHLWHSDSQEINLNPRE